VFQYRANRRQYLCRPIFQYRSAADVGGENASWSQRSRAFSELNVWWIVEFGSGSTKAEHGPLIVPGKRQT
jgi:hypothetical protein